MEKDKGKLSKRDRSVDGMQTAALFWVLKDPETGKYLAGDENGYSWTDTLGQAMAIDSAEVDDVLYDILDNWETAKELFGIGPEQLDARKAKEKDFWGEEYQNWLDPDFRDGIIDSWDMLQEYKDRLKPTPVYASKFHESKGGITVKELDGVKADIERALANLKAIQKKLTGAGTGHDYIFVNGRPFSNAEDALAYQAALMKKRS